MATASEVKSDLDIKTSSWSKYISEGIVRKEKVGQYDSIDVAKQIIRHQQARSRKTTSIISNNAIKINKLEKLLVQQSVGVGTVTDDGVIFEKPMTKKESLDFKIQQQRLLKMEHEHEVRKKSYMPVENVFTFITTIASEFAAFLDPLVGKFKQITPDMNARTHDELVKMIAVGRNNLSRHIEGKTTNELIQLFNPEEDQSSTESTEDS